MAKKKVGDLVDKGNGRYLLKTESVKSAEEYQALVKFLLNKKD